MRFDICKNPAFMQSAGNVLKEQIKMFCITSLEDGNVITFEQKRLGDNASSLEVSKNKKDWIPMQQSLSITINNSETLYIRNAAGIDIASSSSPLFSTSERYNVGGDIRALINPTGIAFSGMYKRAFYSSTYTLLVSAKELIIGTEVSQDCCKEMFLGCRYLTEAPELPATALEQGCYQGMFSNCDSLLESPILPATEMKDYCYQSMFASCTSLTEAPELPATKLAPSCYKGMFYGCTSLTNAPELPVMELDQNCYQNMFKNCTSLTEAPELPATEMKNYCYANMFEGCTSLTEAPELPATTIVMNCYEGMFKGCTSLTEAPELPASTITDTGAYNNMFEGCSNLTMITCLITAIDQYSTYEWVKGVGSTGTFVKSPGITWSNGISGIPEGWTVQDYAG